MQASQFPIVALSVYERDVGLEPYASPYIVCPANLGIIAVATSTIILPPQVRRGVRRHLSQLFKGAMWTQRISR